MVYLVLIIIIFYGIYQYDFCSKEKNKSEVFFYVCIILTCISAFKYRVGSDVLSYMSEYEEYLPLGQLDFNYLFGNTQRQPGWILLMATLKSFSCSFFIFQLIQAVFVNAAVGHFVYRNGKYIFTTMLFYVVFVYAELNFEVMRESFAVGFFLLSLEAYKNKSWFRYYVLIFLSFSFHLSAFFLFLLPLLRYAPINRKSITLYLIFLFVLCFFFLPMLHSMLKGIELWGALNEKATSYLNTEKYQIELSLLFQIINFLVLLVSYSISVMYGFRANCGNWLLQLGFLYFFFLVLNIGIPIFYRLNNYILLPYLLLLSDAIYAFVGCAFLKRCRFLSLFFLLIFFMYPRLTPYFEPSGYRDVPVYRKYYPYHSIFTKETDRLRERAF